MSNIIDKIQVSGVTYDIGGGGGVPESAFTAYTATTDERMSQDEEVTAAGLNALNDKITPTVELTQAEYDALTTKDPNTYYIITDAQAGDLTNYYTKSETNTLLGGKADTATTYTKTETDNAITAATSTKQDTLVSGTNIKTINNESLLGSGNIDIQGGGGTVDQTIISGSTNAVAGGAVYDKFDEVEEVTAAGLNVLNDSINAVSGAIPTTTSAVTSGSTAVVTSGGVYEQLGGLKLLKLTQSAYDALSPNYDSNTLYVIVN